jgi:hypothetical protein
MKNRRSRTKKRGGSKSNQKGCGKCNRTRCRHKKQRGGCGTCAIGGGQKGGSDINSGISVSNALMNVFRGFSGQPAIPNPPF